MPRFFYNRHYHQLRCWACKHIFTAWHGNAKFCSERCKQFAYRMERARRPWHYQFKPFSVYPSVNLPSLPDGDEDDLNGLA